MTRRRQADVRKFAMPESVSDALYRCRRNVNDFGYNYSLLLIVVSVGCVLTKPFSLVVIACLLMLWVRPARRAPGLFLTILGTRSGRTRAPGPRVFPISGLLVRARSAWRKRGPIGFRTDHLVFHSSDDAVSPDLARARDEPDRRSSHPDRVRGVPLWDGIRVLRQGLRGDVQRIHVHAEAARRHPVCFLHVRAVRPHGRVVAAHGGEAPYSARCKTLESHRALSEATADPPQSNVYRPRRANTR